MQSNQTGRWAITALMWFGAIAISISSIESTQSNIDIPLVISMALLFASIGTFLLWGLPEIAKMFGRNKMVDAQDDSLMEKTKRTGSSRRIEQLALLLELMDEHEVADFKESLKQRVLDGMDNSDYLDEMFETLRDESQAGR
jgi:hypothetical protein